MDERDFRAMNEEISMESQTNRKAWKIRFFLRILMSPFLLCIILIKYNYHALKHTFLAVKYGGEWITYTKDEPKTIKDVFEELKSNNKVER